MSCQLQDPYNNHGILFLENRSKKLIPNQSNQNERISLEGVLVTSVDPEGVAELHELQVHEPSVCHYWVWMVL